MELLVNFVAVVGLDLLEAFEPLEDMLEAAMLWSLSLVFIEDGAVFPPPNREAGGVLITLASKIGWSSTLPPPPP